MSRRSRAKIASPIATDAQLRAMLSYVRDSAANRPGVYRMISEDGEVVYVGKSKQLRSRLLSYFRAEYPEEKAARIIRQARHIEWDYEPSEFAALLKELRQIKKLRPRYNVAMMRDRRHYAFIKVSRESAAKLSVVRGPSGDDAVAYYGPFIGPSRVDAAVRELNDVLGLRDCRPSQKMHFSDQPELFSIPSRTPGCIRYEVKKCLGPCVGGCSVSEYQKAAALARAFLDGSSDGPLNHLEKEMLMASEALEFERAARLRDKLGRLESLREQFGRLRYAVEKLSFVYNVPGYSGNDRTYIIRRGLVRHEVATPKSAEEQHQLQQLIEEVFGNGEPKQSGVMLHEIDELLLLTSWFRKFPSEIPKDVQFQ